jgi:hypothetical protein
MLAMRRYLATSNNSDVVGNIAEVNEGGKRGMPFV